HARFGGVRPQLQRGAVQALGGGDGGLAVEHAAFRQRVEQGIVQLGEISVERAGVAALDEDFVAAAKSERAKAVPLRLVKVFALRRQLVGKLREHRLDRRLDGVGRLNERKAPAGR